MATKRNVYNEDKANSVFAVKIRKLFEESGNTHGKLAEYIEKETGESVTRQAVGQWCNGNSCPNLKTVPIIAKFFSVSTDYLLTNTEIRSSDIKIKQVCEFTGLSEKSVKGLNALAYLDPDIINTVNCMLQPIYENIDENYNFALCDEEIPFLQKLSKYLRINPETTADERFYISESGKLINAMATNASELPQKTKWTDIVSVKSIEISDVIVKVLFDDVCDSLKELRKSFLASEIKTKYNCDSDDEFPF